MRRLLILALSLSALPFAPGADAAPTLAAYVVERTDPDASSLAVTGSAGVGDRQYAMAAVATATTNAAGAFTGAEGAMFAGVTVEGYAAVRTPAGTMRCSDLPTAGSACAGTLVAGGIAFIVMWSDVTFDRVLVVLRGEDLDVAASDGWTVSEWTGSVRVADNADAASVMTTGGGAAAFAGETALPGGANGSIAIGHAPCHILGTPAPGAGALLLSGGRATVAAACPEFAPPASAASGATTWKLTGAAAGLADVPARLVVLSS